MAKSKKKKILIIVVLLAVVAVVVVMKNKIVTSVKLKGSWVLSGTVYTYEELLSNYPGLSVDLSGNVTVSSRPELKGRLSGNTIKWTNSSSGAISEWVKA